MDWTTLNDLMILLQMPVEPFAMRMFEVVGIGGTFLLIFGYGMYTLERRRLELRAKTDEQHFNRLNQTIEKSFETQSTGYREILNEIHRTADAQFEFARVLTKSQDDIKELSRAVAELATLTKQELSQISLIAQAAPEPGLMYSVIQDNIDELKQTVQRMDQQAQERSENWQKRWDTFDAGQGKI